MRDTNEEREAWNATVLHELLDGLDAGGRIDRSCRALGPDGQVMRDENGRAVYAAVCSRSELTSGRESESGLGPVFRSATAEQAGGMAPLVPLVPGAPYSDRFNRAPGLLLANGVPLRVLRVTVNPAADLDNAPLLRVGLYSMPVVSTSLVDAVCECTAPSLPAPRSRRPPLV